MNPRMAILMSMLATGALECWDAVLVPDPEGSLQWRLTEAGRVAMREVLADDAEPHIAALAAAGFPFVPEGQLYSGVAAVLEARGVLGAPVSFPWEFGPLVFPPILAGGGK